MGVGDQDLIPEVVNGFFGLRLFEYGFGFFGFGFRVLCPALGETPRGGPNQRLPLSPVCNPYCKQVQVQEPLKLDVWTFCPHVYSVHHPSHTHNSKFTSRRSKTLTSTLLLDPTSCLAMVARWAHLRTAFMKMNGKLLSFPSLISILDAYVSILKDE